MPKFKVAVRERVDTYKFKVFEAPDKQTAAEMAEDDDEVYDAAHGWEAEPAYSECYVDYAETVEE